MLLLVCTVDANETIGFELRLGSLDAEYSKRVTEFLDGSLEIFCFSFDGRR